MKVYHSIVYNPVYYVMESCIRPSGAWASKVADFTTEEEARECFRSHGWEGPSFGIIRARTIGLYRREWRRRAGGMIVGADRTKIAERELD